MSRALLLASGGMALALLAGVPAMAQSESAQAALALDSDSSDALADIVVTGSSIRGVAPVGSGLISVDRSTIDDIKPADTKELLSYMPALGNFGINAEQSTPGRFRTAGYYPNIHNVGIYATLVLINGHRIAPTGGEAVFPDPTLIPTIALDHVEVVADGGSAIYGSDAVAGVVNFIYRRNFQGVEASGTIGFNGTRYRKYNADLIAGHSWGTGNVMLAYEFTRNLSPWNTDISFLALGGDQTSRGGRDLRGSNCMLPNVTIDGTAYAYQADGSFIPNDRNLCGVLARANVVPDNRRHAVLLTARQEVGSNVELWGEFNYSNNHTYSLGTQSSMNMLVNSTNPYYRLPDGVTGTPTEQVIRSGIGLFPQNHSVGYSKIWAVTGGADVKLGGDWIMNVMAHASKTNDYNSDPEIDQINMENAINGTTPDTALNPFGQAADNNPAVLASINNGYTRDNITSQRLREVQVKADGPIFAIGGGDIRGAFGVDMQNVQLVQQQVSGSLAPGARPRLDVRDDNIERTVTAGFGELNIPLVSDQNAMPGVQKLTLSLAGRYDYYQKYGGQFNPKLGAAWSPVQGVDVHGSYGTSFVAPNMGMITSTFTYMGALNQNTQVTDFRTGLQIPRPFNIWYVGGGNPDLQPETADTWSLGVDFKPAAVPGLTASLNYYNVTYKNTTYKVSLTEAVTNPAFGAYAMIKPPAGSDMTAWDEALAYWQAKSPPEMDVPSYIDYQVILQTQAVNLGQRKFQGLDFAIGYSFDTDAGRFGLNLNGNQKLVDKQQVLPGTPWDSRLGTDQAPKTKARLMATWALQPVSLMVGANYTSGFRYQSGAGWVNASSYKTVDATASYTLDFINDRTAIQGRVINLFNTNPPFTDNANGYLPSIGSPFGRIFEISLRAGF